MEFDHRKRYASTGPDTASSAPVPGKQTLTQGVVQLHPAAAPSSERAVPASSPPLPVPAGPRPTLQMLFGRRDKASGPEQVHAAAARGTATAATQLPHLAQIQRSFGKHDVSHVQAHIGAEAAASAQEMGAAAYATGNHVVLGAGTDLHTVAHEAAHVVQQRGGVQLAGGVGEVGDAYERHADAVADMIVQGKSAEVLLDEYATGSGAPSADASSVQRIDDHCHSDREHDRDRDRSDEHDRDCDPARPVAVQRMTFVWHKAKHGTEKHGAKQVDTTTEIDTATSNSRWAARYLAKNWPQVCGLDLARLADAYWWLSSFRNAHADIDQGKAAIEQHMRQVANARFIGEFPLMMTGDNTAKLLQKEIGAAIVTFLCANEYAILTDTARLHPRFEGRAVIPTRIPIPANVMAGIEALFATLASLPEREAFRHRVNAELRRHYDRTYVDAGAPEAFIALWATTAPILERLQADRVKHTGVSKQAKTAVDHEMADTLFEPPPTPPKEMNTAVDHEMVDTPSAPPLTPVADAPIDHIEQRRDSYMTRLSQACRTIGQQMKTMSLESRSILMQLVADAPIDHIEQTDDECGKMRTAVRNEALKERDRLAMNPQTWAAALRKDGFDPTPLEQGVKSGTPAQQAGYMFQINQTLDAWAAYRLLDIECHVGTNTMGSSRYVDTLERLVSGEFRYREYKSYNPNPAQSDELAETQKQFRAQLFDYGTTIGQLSHHALEYIFEHGVPEWVSKVFRDSLELWTGMFPNGLLVTDARSQKTIEVVKPHISDDGAPMEFS